MAEAVVHAPLTPDIRRLAARAAVRLVACVVLVAGLAKFLDVGLPAASGLHYERPTLAAVGTVELLLPPSRSGAASGARRCS